MIDKDTNQVVVDTQFSQKTVECDSCAKNSGSQSNSGNSQLQMSKKSFLTSLAILVAVVLFVGILTFVITPGQFQYDSNGKIIPGTWQQVSVSDTNRLPVYRWITAPIEALFLANGNGTIIQVCAMLLALGGAFFIIEKTGGIHAMIIQLVSIFTKRKYLGMWVITAFIMVLSSVFGLQEHFLILFPIIMGLCVAMNWDNMIAICMILLTSGVGFTVALSNPFSIGTASSVMDTSIIDGMWFRAICLVIFYVITSLVLVKMARNSEKRNMLMGISGGDIGDMNATPQTSRIATMYISLFLGVLVLMIVVSCIPSLYKLTMAFMAGGFIVGTFTIGTIINKNFVATARAFGKGVVALLPSVLLVLLAYSAKYLAEEAMIMDTIFDKLFPLLDGKSPFVTIILIYLVILILEFFIPSASSKATLVVPLLCMLPLEGLSPQLIILIFLFADGFTNVFFPTCATLIVGLSLAKVSFAQWVKKTWWFQLAMMAVSIVVLFVAQLIGY